MKLAISGDSLTRDRRRFPEMEFLMNRNIFAAMAMFAALAFVSQTASAQIGRGNLPNYLFSQYTTQGQGSATAGMYPAPHPVPAYVGHSYRTYQPLMPHEMMYQHERNYYNYYNDNSYYGGGKSLNVTSVRWQSGHGGYRPLPGANHWLSKLQYGVASRAYCLGGGCDVLGKLKSRCAGGNCDQYVVGEAVEAGGCATCGGN